MTSAPVPSSTGTESDLGIIEAFVRQNVGGQPALDAIARLRAAAQKPVDEDHEYAETMRSVAHLLRGENPAQPLPVGDKGEAVAWQYREKARGPDWFWQHCDIPHLNTSECEYRPLFAAPQPLGLAYSAWKPDLEAATNAVRDEIGSRLCHLTPHGTRICSRQVSSVCLCEETARAALCSQAPTPSVLSTDSQSRGPSEGE